MTACLGTKLDLEILQHITAPQPVEEFLEQGAAHCIFVRQQERNHANGTENTTQNASWEFAHDIIQETIYHGWIPSYQDRICYHYRLGRKLWRVLNEEQLEDYLFLVVSQLVFASDLLTDDRERIAIARLCLSAGIKGVASSNFRKAYYFLQQGNVVLGPQGWHRQYDLWLELHNAAAEVATSLGDFEVTFEHVAHVVDHARSFDDSLRALTTKVHALGNSGKFQQSSDEGLALLGQLGVDLPWKPSKIRIMLDWWLISRRLRRKSNESLMRLPEMTDPQKLAAMQVLNLIFVAVAVVNIELTAVIGLKMISLTLDHGLSALSCVAFGVFAFSVGAIGQDPDQSYRFGQLSFMLYEKYGTRAYLARISAIHFEGSHCWQRPASEMFGPLQNAYQVGLETGDVEFALLCACLPSWVKIEYECLPKLEQELSVLRERMKKYRQTTFEMFTRPVHDTVHNLMGLSEDPTILKSPLAGEQITKAIKDNTLGSVHMWAKAHEVLLCCLFGKYQIAKDLSLTASEIAKGGFGPLGGSFVMFYCGFAEVALARETKRGRALMAKKYSRLLGKWSIRAPQNFLGNHSFLEAELAALANDKRTYLKFVNAIAVLKETKHTLLVAFANERLAYYLRDIEKTDESLSYFREALTVYQDFGAKAKVSHLMECMQRMGYNQQPAASG
uniref:Uncharacterized protein n=1 Tax=Entomoneis paludosa TaxID=265537 RepID=A0A7S3DSP7_9STRA